MANIPQIIDVFLQALPKPINILVAYSGGVDSTVLLHALVQARNSHSFDLSAVHVHHGLYSDADQWEKLAETTCASLNVPLHKVRLTEKPATGESIEAWAREQRYAAFEKILSEGGYLLTAQHADDQTETILLQWLRGSGVKGLMGMPEQKPLGLGILARPLLSVDKEIILDYAREFDLTWVEDHSNNDTRFDRNYLRQEIIPRLKQRWPALNRTSARTAKHLAELYERFRHCEESEARRSNPHQKMDCFSSLHELRNDNLLISKLLTYSGIQQKHLIRSWLEEKKFPMPPATKLNEIITSVLQAKPDANPEVTWGNVHIRRYRDELYALTTEETMSLEGMEFEWDGITPLELPYGVSLRASSMRSNPGQEIDCFASLRESRNDKFTIRFRSGGETIHIPGRGTKTLKNLFQEMGIPPWQRPRIPLIYQGDTLIAILTKF